MAKTRNQHLIENYQEFTPFIEHKLSKTLRRILKYSFRTATILMVLFFSSISISAVSIFLHLSYCYFYDFPFYITGFEIWMILEALFLLGMNLKYRVFRTLNANHLPRVNRADLTKIIQEFSKIDDIGKFFEGWFFGAPSEQITKTDIIEWTAGMFFNSLPENLTQDELVMTEEFVESLESRFLHPLKERSEGQKPLKKIRLTLDKLDIYHRPIVYYVIIQLIDWLCRIILQILGFARKNDSELPFYIRSGTSKDPAVVFFHGLGIGLTSYIPFVTALAIQYPDRNILLFEMPSIQMKLDENHVLPHQYAKHVANCLLNHGLRKNIVAGHSLGTACVRWMDLFYPELVHSRIFIDPIVFNLWEHHIAHNALYREPKTFHEAFLKYIGMAEPGHATYLHRYFVWFQNTYFSPELPKDCFVFLSEKDNIVDSPGVAKYLKANASSTRRIIVIKCFRHGQILANPEAGRILNAIEKLSKMH